MPSFKMTRVCSYLVTRPVYQTSTSEIIGCVDLVESSFQDTKGLRAVSQEVNLTGRMNFQNVNAALRVTQASRTE